MLGTAALLLVSSLAVLMLFKPPEDNLCQVVSAADLENIEHSEWSLVELREHLEIVTFGVDLLILLLVSVFLYFFARRTLEPIRLNQEKQVKFMSDVAHELRTPLSVMRSGAETLLRREHTNDEYRDFVSDVAEESVRLARLSNQLLQLLRLGSAKDIEKSAVNLSDLVKNEVERFAAYAKERNINLVSKVVTGVTITAEEDSLVQLLQNLLKNAIDYTDDGEVAVSLVAEDDTVRLFVNDNGVGIPQDKQEEIFSRFSKLDKARKATGDTGAGLGLSIVKEIVDRHQGKIIIDSEVGVGTTMTIVLPLEVK